MTTKTQCKTGSFSCEEHKEERMRGMFFCKGDSICFGNNGCLCSPSYGCKKPSYCPYDGHKVKYKRL